MLYVHADSIQGLLNSVKFSEGDQCELKVKLELLFSVAYASDLMLTGFIKLGIKWKQQQQKTW